MPITRAHPTGATRREFLQGLLGVSANGLIIPNSSLASHARALKQNAGSEGRAAQFGSGIHNVRAFGAVGDGRALDTAAINKAIEQASSAGGGTVYFPSGAYLCFSIRLKSNIALDLSPGAKIVAADTPQDSRGGYDEAEPNLWDKFQDFGHSHWHNALLWGEGLENVEIRGPGVIWGKGLTSGRNERGAGVGDKSISLKNCHKVALRDFSILHGGHFGILATGVDNLTIDNVLVDTNRDGIDIDCCRNVRVSNCSVNSPWDDAICPKSSYALGYARATENVTIANCLVTGDYQEGTLLDGTFKRFEPDAKVSRTGRVKCGTESNGGFKNIAISNCVFDSCQGLALESVDGAVLEDIVITNLTMRNIVNPPFFLRLGSRMRGPSGAPVGSLRRVSISNVVVSHTAAPYASIISGIPGYEVEDIRLSDIFILHEGGGTRDDAALQPPERGTAYPEPNMFGPTPAYAFFIRHAKGIDMSNVELRTIKEDLRPAFVLNDVNGVGLVHLDAPRVSDVPIFALRSVEDFNLSSSPPLHDTHLEKAEQKSLP